MNPPEEEGGPHYSTRLSQIEEKLGGGGTREIWAAGGETVYNLTRARAAPLFEVRWLGWGWPICRATLLLSAVLT
jgi:hypothetical protein